MIKINENSTYQTYLINLDRATDRLQIMKKEFEKIRLPFVRISAVDGNHLEKERYTIQNKYDRGLLPGEIGCFLSHVKTLNIFLKSKHQFALIVEDDAKFIADFVPIIEKTLNNYQNLPLKHQWDVLKLFNNKRRNIFVKSIDENYFLGACGTSIPITTLIGIWSKKGAEKFLSKVNAQNPVIKRPIDCELQHPWEYNLLVYNLLPTMVSFQKVSTQIVKRDDPKRKAKLSRQIRYEISRFFPKHFYYINQHGLKKYLKSFIFRKNKKVG